MTTAFEPARPLIFGEVLFDCFPDGTRVLGGAPFNVAWHLQAFGAAPLFVSRVGEGANGREIICSAMTAWGMDRSGMQIDTGHKTGEVAVSLSTGGQPSFDIVDDRAYDYIGAEAAVGLPPLSLIYHGSLALRREGSRRALTAIRKASGAPAFVDINLREPWWNKDEILARLDGAKWVKLNDAELDLLTGTDGDAEARAEALRRTHGLALLVVTRGEKGALALTADGQREKVAPEAATTVVDTVGAGDAFASVLVLGLLRDWPLADTLIRAQHFASAIVGVRGATVSDPAFYTPFRTAWGLD